MFQSLKESMQVARHLGFAGVCRTIGKLIWSEQRYFELSCDLAAMPPIRKAKIPVVMQPQDPQRFQGFEQELLRTKGSDAIQVLLRMRSSRAGIENLYVAYSGDQPVYCHWLVPASKQDRIHAHAPHAYRRLKDEEGMLEGSYTFVDFRGLGVMHDGMWQVLQDGKSRGIERVITYVADDNIPSLLGCKRVGFKLASMRVARRRLVLYKTTVTADADATAHEVWDKLK